MSSNNGYETGCSIIILLLVGGGWIFGTGAALYAIYTDQSGNTTEGVGIVYLICTVLIGIVLFLCWRSSEDIDKAKKRLSEKKTQLQKLREQKRNLQIK